MAEVLPAGDKIRDYDSRVDPDAPKAVAQEEAEKRRKSHSLLGYFSIIQIHVITLVLTLASSGLVPLEDLAFVAFTTLYLAFMNATIFKPVTKGPPPNVMAGSKWVQKYALFAAGVGLVAPSGYVLGSFVHGDQRALKATAPHLFLLGCQVLTENVTFRNNRVSLPTRALVPIFYNVRRLFTIVEWVKVDFQKGVSESMGMHGADPAGPISSHHWILMGRYLAIANLIVWAFNLFFFLIPVFLPRTFRKHYEMDASASKTKAKDADFDNATSTDF
jgi:hypothetical protein